MSTRCQIGFYEKSKYNVKKPYVLLYKHSDGYPGEINGDGSEKKYGVVPLLLPFLQKFQDQRGLDDTEYVAAWVMWHLINEHVGIMQDVHKQYPKYATPEGWDFLGHGVCKVFHVDIEYFYAVHPHGLDVYETGCEDWDKPNTRTFTKIASYSVEKGLPFAKCSL